MVKVTAACRAIADSFGRAITYGPVTGILAKALCFPLSSISRGYSSEAVGYQVIIRAAAVLAAFLISAPVIAADFSGVKLLEYCSDHSDLTGRFGCLLFLQGYIGGIVAGEGSKEKKDRLWCFPEGATVEQARRIVEKYLRDNPRTPPKRRFACDACSTAGLPLPKRAKIKLGHYRGAGQSFEF